MDVDPEEQTTGISTGYEMNVLKKSKSQKVEAVWVSLDT